MSEPTEPENSEAEGLDNPTGTTDAGWAGLTPPPAEGDEGNEGTGDGASDPEGDGGGDEGEGGGTGDGASPDEKAKPAKEKGPTRGPNAKQLHCQHCDWKGKRSELKEDTLIGKPHYCPKCGRSDGFLADT